MIAGSTLASVAPASSTAGGVDARRRPATSWYLRRESQFDKLYGGWEGVKGKSSGARRTVGNPREAPHKPLDADDVQPARTAPPSRDMHRFARDSRLSKQLPNAPFMIDT